MRIQDNPKYKIDKNVLYKIIDGQWKIMVPDELVEDLTWACHERAQLMQERINAI